MGYACYERDGRDCGYGVPAICDHPECNEEIDRGLGYICGGSSHHDEGCWRFFCAKHTTHDHHENEDVTELCERCANDKPAFDPSPDTDGWIEHKMIDPSWDLWRSENPEFVAANIAVLDAAPATITE